MMAAGLAAAVPLRAQTANEVNARLKEVEAKLTELSKLKDELESLKEAMKSQAEAQATTSNDLAILQRFRFNGYVQARYTSDSSISPHDNLHIRRARLDFRYKLSSLSSVRAQMDVGQQNFVMKDAYLDYTFPGKLSRNGVTFTIGQHKWPFGYENQQSSGDREFPERTLVNRQVLPDERDIGVKLAGFFGPPTIPSQQTNWQLGLYNGTGTSRGLGGGDRTSTKDLVGSLQHPITKSWDARVSGYLGAQRDEVVQSNRRKLRLGFDTQYYFGDNALKFEGYAGRGVEGATAAGPLAFTFTGQSGVQTIATRRRYTITPDPFVGYWAQYSRNLNQRTSVHLKFDYFDPNKNAARDATTTYGLAMHHWIDDATRFRLAWVTPQEQGARVRNNALIAEFMYKW